MRILDTSVRARCTQAEKKAIEDRAAQAGLSLSEFLRRLLKKGMFEPGKPNGKLTGRPRKTTVEEAVTPLEPIFKEEPKPPQVGKVFQLSPGCISAGRRCARLQMPLCAACRELNGK